MATRTKSIDIQKLVSDAATLEIKLLNAGVEAMQVYIKQASRFSELTAQTLQEVQDDKATLAQTARKVSTFGRESLQAYADLTQRLGTRYYDELDRLANSSSSKTETVKTAASPKAPVKRTRVAAARKGSAKPARAAVARKR